MGRNKYPKNSIWPFEILLFFFIMIAFTFGSFLWEKKCTPSVLLSYPFYGSLEDGSLSFFLPESAVFSDEDQSFVYAMEPRKTIYRDEFRVQQVSVTILQESSTMVAISGEISPEMQYVSASDKVLSDGALIRIIE